MKTRLGVLTLLGASGFAQTGIFTPTGNMTAPRVNHTATLLPDGKVLIRGGVTTCYVGVSSCIKPDFAELYDPATGTFTTTTAYAEGGDFLPDGRVLWSISSGGVQIYDPSTGELTVGKPATLASVTIVTVLSDGRILLIGGVGGSNPQVFGAQLYDPVSDSFSDIANWLGATASPYWYTVVLADDKVLFAPYDSNSGCEIYDPATNAFHSTSALWYFLGVPDMTLLLNGRILFTGGSDDFGNVNFAELYDPTAGIFTSNGSMSTARDGHSATLLPDGKVLVAAGAGQSSCTEPPLASAEIYDPATSGFSTTGSLASPRSYHTATLLNNGQVLITGGTAFTAGCQPLPTGTPINGMSTAELYTPAVLVPAPALFTASGDGKGQGAIWHAQTGQVATTDNPAASGEALSMYTTSLANGGVIAPQVIVGGRLAKVLYYGAAPGYPGYYQVNFVVPAGVSTGPAVSVRLRYIGRSSNAVTIATK